MKIKSTSLDHEQVPVLLAKLDALLPHSIPLARRVRFHLDHPSESARVFVATATHDHDHHLDVDVDGDRAGWDEWLRSVPLTSMASQLQSRDSAYTGPRDEPWVAAHIDLVNPGQTQVWLFASWERPASERPRPILPIRNASQPQPQPALSPPRVVTDTGTDTDTNNPNQTTHQSLMTALFTYIHRDLVPLMPTTPPADWLELQRTGKYLTTPYSRTKVLFGTVHEDLWDFLPREVRARTDEGYWKYIFFFPTDSTGEGPDEDGDVVVLPAGQKPDVRKNNDYVFGKLDTSHLQAVMDRTPIPRTLSTLSQLPNLGVFSQTPGNATTTGGGAAQAIAWGFLGKDDSVSSLHTEPEFRGQGLAVSLGRELLRRQRERQLQRQKQSSRRADADATMTERQREEEAEEEEQGWWAHADVSASNTASRKVMEKLGGTPLWRVAWTEVDLERLLSLSRSS